MDSARTTTGTAAVRRATGVSPRTQATILYLMDGFDDHASYLERLGPHSLGKACLYVKRLDDLDEDVLRDLLSASVDRVRTMDQS